MALASTQWHKPLIHQFSSMVLSHGATRPVNKSRRLRLPNISQIRPQFPCTPVDPLLPIRLPPASFKPQGALSRPQCPRGASVPPPPLIAHPGTWSVSQVHLEYKVGPSMSCQTRFVIADGIRSSSPSDLAFRPPSTTVLPSLLMLSKLGTLGPWQQPLPVSGHLLSNHSTKKGQLYHGTLS